MITVYCLFLSLDALIHWKQKGWGGHAPISQRGLKSQNVGFSHLNLTRNINSKKVVKRESCKKAVNKHSESLTTNSCVISERPTVCAALRHVLLITHFLCVQRLGNLQRGAFIVTLGTGDR